jgi:2-keto-4-pentenoate hydratase/2-oxohepta-3-ene-1,7-dioic acid hydratase in catechol pathway
MRLATILEPGRTLVAYVHNDAYLPVDPAVDEPGIGSIRAFASGGQAAVDRAAAWLTSRAETDWRPLEGVSLGPAIRDPGAIYTIGANYRAPGEPVGDRPARPRVLAKLPSSVAGHGAVVHWDRSVTANVDGECELAVVVGRDASVFGYTIVNDMNSVDPWLDGDQWLLGKSMAGFCPIGPWIVTADAFDPSDVRLGCMINGQPIQDGRTSEMRFSIAEMISYIGRHVDLRPGDVIATGTPARLASPPGPDRHLEMTDIVTCWIEGIGELTNTIA